VPLERWLVQLLHELFDEHGFHSPDEEGDQTAGQRGADGAPTVSIYERLRDDEARHIEEPDTPAHEINPDSPYAAEDGWAVENNPNWPFVDSLTRDDVLPDDEAPEPWQALAAEEERRVILDELKRFARDQRRALALHVLDGWTIDEIAEAQERPADEVARDIEAVRRALRRRLSPVAERSRAGLPS
jgi:DNA-directed RNA polymerase specialized sigma24 family protein